MKKKVLLIDRGAHFIDSLKNSNDIEVSLLIVESYKQKEMIESGFCSEHNIYTMKEIQDSNYIDLTYDDIEKYRATQLKVTNALLRHSDNLSLINYRYYQALSFWLHIFRNIEVDVVILGELEHGTPMHSIPLEIAKNISIPTFILEPILSTGKDLSWAVKIYNNDRYLDLRKVSSFIKTPDIDKYMFNSEKHIQKKRFAPKEMRNDLTFTYFGIFLTTFISFFNKKYKIYLWGFRSEWFDIFKNIFYVYQIKRYYKKLSKKPRSESYLFYAMHFEPEAGTIARTIFNNQLAIVKILHDNLPDGWKLYVKEHPHQYQLVNKTAWYYLKNLHLFKNTGFYYELDKLKNVRIIDLDVGSRELLENAAAVSTINGTIVMEALKFGKPIFMFSYTTHPLGGSRDVFKIESVSDVRASFKKLIGGFIPKYGDPQQIVDKYLFELSSPVSFSLKPELWKHIVNFKLEDN